MVMGGDDNLYMIQATMNGLGNEGWELVGLLLTPSEDVVAVFKRSAPLIRVVYPEQ